jgi:hypothetical protein
VGSPGASRAAAPGSLAMLFAPGRASVSNQASTSGLLLRDHQWAIVLTLFVLPTLYAWLERDQAHPLPAPPQTVRHA